MAEENAYHSRIVRLKPIIDADSGIKNRISSAFSAVYDDRFVTNGKLLLSNGLISLGSGTNHDVIGLGKVVTDPHTEAEIHLAIKLNHRRGYSARLTSEIEQQLGAYDYAFESGLNPPYFVGVVTAEGNNCGFMSRIAGVLTEDISKGKTLKLKERPDEEFCERVLSDGTVEKIFLDPRFGAFSSNGELYLRDEARIDI